MYHAQIKIHFTVGNSDSPFLSLQLPYQYFLVFQVGTPEFSFFHFCSFSFLSFEVGQPDWDFLGFIFSSKTTRVLFFRLATVIVTCYNWLT